MTIGNAKVWLNKVSPFFGTIIFHTPVIEDESIGTLGVDGRNLYVNNKFWDTLSSRHKIGILAHEVGHIALGHIWRKGFRNDIVVNLKSGQTVLLWNIAADYVINGLIVRMMGKNYLPKFALLNPDFSDKSVEEVYDMLLKEIPTMSDKMLLMLVKEAMGSHKKWNKMSEKQKKETRERVSQILQHAIEQQKQKGDLPMMLKRLYEELTPKEDWRKVLMDYSQNFQNDYTFKRQDRRYADEDFFLPDVDDEQELNWVAIGVDTSGSISKQQISDFIGEVKGILSSFDKVTAKITFCDADATPLQDISVDNLNFDVRGGGGTSFCPVFDLIKKEDTQPKLLIYFTDLAGDYPKNEPEYDSLWVAEKDDWNKSYTPPFGRVLSYKHGN